MEHKTLAEAVAAASKIVGGRLAPDKTNLEQRYDYLSADLILSVCGQALADCGLTVFPAILDETLALVERPNKSPRLDVKVTMSFEVSNAAQARAYPWVGRGSDYVSPDKALYKAVTSGHKYFLMKLLNVGAGNEDGEHEGEDAPPEPPRPPARPVAAPPAPPARPSAPPAPANDGAKTERPYTPDHLRELMVKASAAHDAAGKSPTDPQTKMLPVNLAQLFLGSSGDHDEMRHAITLFLFEKDSTNDLTPGEKLALVNWINRKKNENGEWIPDFMAIHEAKAILEKHF